MRRAGSSRKMSVDYSVDGAEPGNMPPVPNTALLVKELANVVRMFHALLGLSSVCFLVSP